MPPKKDKKDDKKEKQDEAAADSGASAELAALQGAKLDLELGHAILTDKLRQSRAENERLLQEVERFKARISNATSDYVDILQHREEQVKAADARTTSLQQQVDRLQAELASHADAIAKLKESNASQALRLEDASSLLADKDKLEEAVRKQAELIEARGQEIKVARAQISAKDAALDKARLQIEELGLQCQASTTLKVLFSEPWLLQTTYVKLKGNIPFDRECNVLACSAGGKLILHGGQSRTHESVSRETAVLSLDGLTWEQPDSAVLATGLLGHSATTVGRNKLLVFGGITGDEATATTQVLSTDTMKWQQLAPTSVNQTPPPRLMHASCNLRDKVYVFGGMTLDGHLLDDLWVLDNQQWSHCVSYGIAPSARKGASLCASEDGRRLILFGGHDGTQLLNDCCFLEVERLTWSRISPGGSPPEPRAHHTAAVLGRWFFVTGGSGASVPPPAALAGHAGVGGPASSQPAAAAAAAGAAGRRLSDTHVLDMFSGPAWEQLDDGAWSSNVPWLKQMSTTTVMHGNKLYTLQPNLHEQLDQLLVMELTLPEDIERMKTAKRDQKQIDRLELLPPGPTSSTSIEVAWRPPTKHSERINSYKLMIASSTGVVREVFQGKAQSFTVTKLQPAAEYVLCVKASFDDGSFLWSESRAFHTKMA